jgi:hypothetical protein
VSGTRTFVQFEEEACVNKQMTTNGAVLCPVDLFEFFQYTTHVLPEPSMYSLSIKYYVCVSYAFQDSKEIGHCWRWHVIA